MMNVSRELREMVEDSSIMMVREFEIRSLLDAKKKVLIILVKELFRLRDRRTAVLVPIIFVPVFEFIQGVRHSRTFLS